MAVVKHGENERNAIHPQAAYAVIIGKSSFFFCITRREYDKCVHIKVAYVKKKQNISETEGREIDFI